MCGIVECEYLIICLIHFSSKNQHENRIPQIGKTGLAQKIEQEIEIEVCWVADFEKSVKFLIRSCF